MAQINFIAVFLVILALLGVLSSNSTLTIAATLLLLIQQTALSQYLPLIEKHGLSWGIILLTMGVLAPVVSGKVALPSWQALLHWKMGVAMAVGMLVAWLGARGVPVMSGQPVLLVGLMVGTILGVALLGGVPVGPLIAAGILSLFLGKS